MCDPDVEYHLLAVFFDSLIAHITEINEICFNIIGYLLQYLDFLDHGGEANLT